MFSSQPRALQQIVYSYTTTLYLDAVGIEDFIRLFFGHKPPISTTIIIRTLNRWFFFFPRPVEVNSKESFKFLWATGTNINHLNYFLNWSLFKYQINRSGVKCTFLRINLRNLKCFPHCPGLNWNKSILRVTVLTLAELVTLLTEIKSLCLESRGDRKSIVKKKPRYPKHMKGNGNNLDSQAGTQFRRTRFTVVSGLLRLPARGRQGFTQNQNQTKPLPLRSSDLEKLSSARNRYTGRFCLHLLSLL